MRVWLNDVKGELGQTSSTTASKPAGYATTSSIPARAAAEPGKRHFGDDGQKVQRWHGSTAAQNLRNLLWLSQRRAPDQAHYQRRSGRPVTVQDGDADEMHLKWSAGCCTQVTEDPSRTIRSKS